jgi:hypothetical protein
VGKKSGPKPPPAPDPYKTAEAQTQMNRETAIAQAHLSRINQYSPWGDLTYNITGYNSDGTPRYEQRVNLSPDQQALLNQQNQVSLQLGNLAAGQIDRVNNTINQPFNFNGAPSQVTGLNLSGLPQMSTGVTPQDMQRNIAGAGNIQSQLGNTGDVQGNVNLSGAPGLPGTDNFGAERQRVEDSLYNRAASRLDPQFNQAQSDLTAKLANQGIAQGSEAYNREMDNFSRSRNDAYSAANWDAINAGGAEQSRLFADALRGRQQYTGEQFGLGEFANSAQAQQFAQALGAGQFGNQAQQQQYDQNASNAAFYNAAGESMFQQGMANAGLQNQARAQGYNELAGNAELQNTARQQYINEQTFLRNLPLSDIATLMGTAGSPAQPQFNPVAQVGMDNTDVMGAVYDSYNANFNNWQAQNANRQAGKGQMFGAIGTGAGLALSKKISSVLAPWLTVLLRIPTSTLVIVFAGSVSLLRKSWAYPARCTM